MTSDPLDGRDLDAINREFKALRSDLASMRIEARDNFATTWLKQDMTNGRVRALERWRDVIVGALAVLVALGLPEVIRELLAMRGG